MNLPDGIRKHKPAPVRTFLVEPFDLGLHTSVDGLAALQARFAAWLRSLDGPARFVCWLMPAILQDKIARLEQAEAALAARDPQRAELLMAYRRHYEQLQEGAHYQRSLCGIGLWTEDNPRGLLSGLTGAFQTYVAESRWPALFEGR